MALMILLTFQQFECGINGRITKTTSEILGHSLTRLPLLQFQSIQLDNVQECGSFAWVDLNVTVKDIDDIVKVNVDITNAGQGTNQSTFLTLGNNKKRK